MACCIEVPLSGGLVALIDEQDLSAVCQHKWVAHPKRSKTGRHLGWYASASFGGSTIYMHRLILKAEKGEQVDHANADGLDNRRENIRLCTNSLNNANRKIKLPKSGFRGVHAHGPSWRAILSEGGRNVYAGTFCDPVSAALAYDAEAKRRYGEFATLNFPEAAAA